MDNNELYHHGIKGMKWGVRRYQNYDGSLTPAGQKRYERDQRENAAKKKENRIDVSNPDPQRWVKEDMERSKKVVDANSSLVKQLKDLEKETAPKATTKRMDLSNMTDKEMRDKINRELLEQQYNKLFAETSEVEVSKGREYVRNTLSVASTVLATTSTSLAIALAIKELSSR